MGRSWPNELDHGCATDQSITRSLLAPFSFLFIKLWNGLEGRQINRCMNSQSRSHGPTLRKFHAGHIETDLHAQAFDHFKLIGVPIGWETVFLFYQVSANLI